MEQKINIDNAQKYGVPEFLIEILKSRKYETFTFAQSAALRMNLCKGENLFITAPTSSGKTTIAEIASVAAAMKAEVKTVYLVIYKALAEEKFKVFKESYDNGSDNKLFSVSIATGDHNEGKWDSGILIATYEKFLSFVSNRPLEHFKNTVVIADEIQILGDENRGPNIEIIS